MVRLEHVTFASHEPRRLAEFWANVLDYEVEAGGDSESARVVDSNGSGLPLSFSRMPKTRTLELPIHLDVNVPDREAEIRRLLELGARLVETKTSAIGELSETWTVMRDPEGNGFCVQEPPRTERRYLGNITFSCAAPKELARFWSEALGWPEEGVEDDFLQMLRDAGIDEWELSAFAVVREGERTRPRLLFQRRQKSPTESIPIHLDLVADDREAEVERLTRAGASLKETKTTASGFTFSVMRDPEGIPFCVG